MRILKENDKIALDELAEGELLQSWSWGETLVQEGAEVLRLGVFENEELAAAATFTKQPLFASFFYLYAPRGPIGSEAACEKLIKEVSKEYGPVFIRLEPEHDLKLGLRRVRSIQPAKTLCLDLHLSEEQLLAAMHQKTRYNIRLAEKKGVTVARGSANDLPEFIRLLHTTGDRDGFKLHPDSHYRALLGNEDIHLSFARYEGKAIAGGLFSVKGGEARYLHGASDNKLRSLMAPYLLQWTEIQSAKAAGCRTYDFYGIDEKKWPGVTRFKLGFGGYEKIFPGTYDYINRALIYRAYAILRALRKIW